MLGKRQDPFVGPSFRGVRADSPPGRSRFGADTMLCPACARSMVRVRTIWRAIQDDLQVFECRACNVSVSVKEPA